MNSKSTWIWILIAAALFAAIVGVEKFGSPPPTGPVPLLPGFRGGIVTSVQFHPPGQLEIRADRTNAAWQLTKPIFYPAQAPSIESLLMVLERLAPAVVISGPEVRQRKNADEEFGFTREASLTLQSRGEHYQLLFGARTAPGDQVYVKVVGAEGVNIVDANLLKLLPRTPNDWRDTALINLQTVLFDHLTISNATATIELQRQPTNQLWRLIRPLAVRADNQRIGEMLQNLHTTRVGNFVTDDLTDLEPFGLNVPALELTLAQGTNLVATLQFGRSPTNDSTLVYARRLGLNTIVTVPAKPIEAWRQAVNEFRDPRLVSFAARVDQIEFRGGEPFTLQRTGSNSWRAVGVDLPLDTRFVEQLIAALGSLRIDQYKDSITDSDLARYGLVEPVRQVIVSSAVTNGGAATNQPLASLAFGATEEEKIFARRADENSVYGVRLGDYLRLPAAVWQLRERQIWNFAAADVVRWFVSQSGQQIELRHAGTNSWVFAPGSQGIVNEFAVEETAWRSGQLAATAWVGRGDELRERLGFTTNGLAMTWELKDGVRHTVEFGGVSPDNYPYAAVKLDGQTWFFEMPMGLFELIKVAFPKTAGGP